jgi:hypothetical protein
MFRTLGTLGQKAGVPTDRLPRLAAKELVANALDAGGVCCFGKLVSGFFVGDNGPGLPGTDEAIAALFSVRRPMTTSKLTRMPTRGALGNGLRVVAGAALASGGSLVVSTRGRTLRLQPQEDGTTRVVGSTPYAKDGTRVEVYFGPVLANEDPRPLCLVPPGAGNGPPGQGLQGPHITPLVRFRFLLGTVAGVAGRDRRPGRRTDAGL